LKECQICGRRGVNEYFCEYHQAAHSNLKSTFKHWTEAIEELTWEEYLRQVYDLENTGRWIKEIIENIMSQDDL
jgi:hypothetical protein